MSESAARPRPDDQQRLAVETLDRSVAVVAGAGTGKTTVLVERFVALLDTRPDWPITSIVAITFTERAAEEMRSRVRQRILERLATAQGSDRRRWADHLARIEAARISTIHGMCSEVIRANAAAAGVDPGFQVADEASAAVLMRDALAVALREIVSAEADTNDPDFSAAHAVLTGYEHTKIEEILLKPKQFRGLQPLPSSVDEVEAMYEAYAADAFQRFFKSSPVMELRSLVPPNAPEDLFVVKVLEAQRILTDAAEAPSAAICMEALARFDMVVSGGSTKLWDVGDLAYAKSLVSEIKQVLKKLSEVLTFDRDVEKLALRLSHGWSMLINRVLAAYEDRKRAENVLDFEDLEIKAEALLARPEVRRRYAGREIRHVMVDEFQDTNHRQWNITQGLAPGLMDGGVFIVGDPKQSIYRFRGADVTIFRAASDQIERAGGLVVRMNRSYRTHSALIAQFNRLFTGVMRPSPDAAQIEQFVTFDENHTLVAQRESPDDHLDVQLIGLDPSTNNRNVASEARIVAARIRDMVTTESLTVVDRRTNQPRPAGYGDIAVLLRSFKSNSKHFEQAFVEFGVPYVTQSGGGFYDRREIRDLIELLKALRNPADNLALAAALHSPLFALSDVDLLALRTRGGALFEALDEEAALQAEHESLEHPIVFANTIYNGLRAIAGRVSADALLLQAIAETNYLASIGRLPDGPQMRANVEKLVDIAREYGAAALPDFITFLDVSRAEDVKEAGVALDSRSSVRLTTIHGCKGLEFPVVWLADGNLATRASGNTVIAAESIVCALPKLGEDKSDSKAFLYQRAQKHGKEADDAEVQRLLYVAATRARDALFISSSKPKFLSALSEALDGQAITVATTPQSPQLTPELLQRVKDTRFPLAETLPAAPPPSRRRLTATDIADYGSLINADTEEERDYYRHRIRRRLHADDFEPVESLTYDAQIGMPSQRRIGSLVHSALLYRVDAMMKNDPEGADQAIDSLVWEAGITLSDARRKVVDRVRSYLKSYINSPIARDIDRAKEVYRELPFVIERDGQLVHGTMDLVYVDHDSRWTVVDFKTDSVPDDMGRITAHARRYLLQLAVYAAALRERIGVTPTAQVVYLRYPQHVVTLPAAELDRELESLKLDAIDANFDLSGPRT